MTTQIQTGTESTSFSGNLATPGEYFVIRRNGQLTPYDDNKIALAVTKAFLAVEGNQANSSQHVHELVAKLTREVTQTIHKEFIGGGQIGIEKIQDMVELGLVREQQYEVHRAYVLYREEHNKLRLQETTQKPQMSMVLDDGSKKPLDTAWIKRLVEDASKDLTDVDSDMIAKETVRNLFDGATLKDIHKALTLSARQNIEIDPNYSFMAARLLLHEIYSEGLRFLSIDPLTLLSEAGDKYRESFRTYINKACELELVNPELKTFDLDKISQAIQPQRDFQFTYLGLQTLHDRYFIHSEEVRFELPQSFFMRVAMGLAIEEGEMKNERAIEFYNLLSSFDFMSSTPTLFNSGTLRSQLSSCFLTTIPDDLEGIYSAIKDNAMLSKFAGGLGNDWTPVRGMGSRIKGTNGKSLGVVPFMKVANDTLVAVNQGGKRKGAGCGYLETWHIDIEEFLELRKNTGDERRRTHDMNTANWIPDLFMQRVFEEKDWTLFSPNEVLELHDTFGLEFKEKYEAYEEKAKRGEIQNKVIPAVNLWRKMLGMLFETGHPWVTFKDPCNLRSPQQHAGVVHSSNLCTEITLNTSAEEVAVCNLGSINLVNHINENGLDLAKLEQTIKTAIRMLDNVIDINYYTVPQARNSNIKHRPIGLG